MRNFFGLLVTLLIYLTITTQAHAVCPVCTVAVGAGLGLCRLIGIDDTISGVWIGGLILSSAFWLADFLKKKNIKLPYPEFWSVIFFFLIIVIPFYKLKMIGITGNTLWGVDKLLLGIIFGSLLFILGVFTDKTLRKLNNNKVYIYYQKVIIPVFYLTLASFIFYLIIC